MVADIVSREQMRHNAKIRAEAHDLTLGQRVVREHYLRVGWHFFSHLLVWREQFGIKVSPCESRD